MSVGTNENLNNKNINEINETANTGEQGRNKVIDMQATQRIDFLGELQRDSDTAAKKLIKNKQGNFVPYSKKKENVDENVEIIKNPGSEISNEPIAQINNLSVENKSEEIVQEIPNINEKIENTQNFETEVNKEEIKESEEEIAKKKEKQHAQDKKDYRLERMLFARINTMQGKIKESLELIQKYERIDAKEGNLPNIVTTLHDKLTQEVIKQFRTVGIEFNMKSFLVQSIVSDLLSKFEEGITEFRNCSENLNFVREVQEDFESRVELAPTSKVKNFFARIRGIFKPERKQEKLEQLERERQEQKLEKANIYLIKYKFINSELAKYTIKNNIVNSLTKEIIHGQGSGLTLNTKEFIAEKIAPEMKKLGLENLLTDLEDRIYKEYSEKHNISKEEFENISVGEIRKNMKFQRADIAINKVMKVVEVNRTNAVDNDDSEDKIAM